MYDGASPSLYVSKHSLNWTRCGGEKPVEAARQHVLDMVVLLGADD